MSVNDSQKPYALSKLDSDTIYNVIKNEAFLSKQLPATDARVAFFTAGQPGSGKTTLRDYLLEEGKEKYTIEINTDDVRKYHPDYENLLRDPINFAKAGYLVNPDCVEWCSRLSRDAVKEGFNVLYDMTFAGNVDNYLKMIEQHKLNKYRVELHVLAVNPDISKLGIQLRFEGQLKKYGVGRFVSMQSHDTNYNGLKGNIQKALDSGLINQVAAYSRKIDRGPDGQIVNNAVKLIHRSEKEYDSNSVLRAISLEQNRAFTPVEKSYLKMRFEQVLDLIYARNGNPDSFLSNSESLLKKIDNKPDNRLKL